MGVIGNEETSNIRLQVCVFEQVCLSFFLSFFLVWLIGFTAYQPFSGHLTSNKFMFYLFVYLFGFYGKSTFVGYLMPIPFLYK